MVMACFSWRSTLLQSVGRGERGLIGVQLAERGQVFHMNASHRILSDGDETPQFTDFCADEHGDVVQRAHGAIHGFSLRLGKDQAISSRQRLEARDAACGTAQRFASLDAVPLPTVSLSYQHLEFTPRHPARW